MGAGIARVIGPPPWAGYPAAPAPPAAGAPVEHAVSRASAVRHTADGTTVRGMWITAPPWGRTTRRCRGCNGKCAQVIHCGQFSPKWMRCVAGGQRVVGVFGRGYGHGYET